MCQAAAYIPLLLATIRRESCAAFFRHAAEAIADTPAADDVGSILVVETDWQQRRVGNRKSAGLRPRAWRVMWATYVAFLA